MLKKKSSNFAEEITHVMSTQIKSSKDQLYEDFKERIEVILRKNFMSDTEK
jgi:antibiotic biosynthesis monooxygenase (ABM) superfamily enzyme